jgi:hypothetical protein
MRQLSSEQTVCHIGPMDVQAAQTTGPGPPSPPKPFSFFAWELEGLHNTIFLCCLDAEIGSDNIWIEAIEGYCTALRNRSCRLPHDAALSTQGFPFLATNVAFPFRKVKEASHFCRSGQSRRKGQRHVNMSTLVLYLGVLLYILRPCLKVHSNYSGPVQPSCWL